ncbi:hypothetical protein F3Y22_tig00111837pilonHSYRG00277 [Hibiscus syriacus]|uniref:RNase H type-1 domain-containing protein n=1 Tax=Hibiscus syriacus TaxID=106335 RepID=A0A6A2Y7I1_HIBSY|nr:hypothetical protein F3Y22_tig00111837pilonHSYRG00277 [Hibiscus syriacus]
MENPNYFPIVFADWDLLFGVILCCLWVCRNHLLFDPSYVAEDSVLQNGRRLTMVALNALSMQSDQRTNMGNRANRKECLKLPPKGSLKINTDGSRLPATGLSSCGGVIRNHVGDWISKFSKFIGICFTIDAKLWGIFEGLNLI